MPVQIDIAEILISKAIYHLSLARKAHNSKQKQLQEFEECIQAVILFQVGMEAVINEEIEQSAELFPIKKENKSLSRKYKSLSFRNKWERAFDALEIKSKKPLNDYLDFYAKYRILISHPKSRYVSLDKYSFNTVHAGLKTGWDTIQELYAALGKTKIRWDDMFIPLQKNTPSS